jgi:tape measure domain-containing protein
MADEKRRLIYELLVEAKGLKDQTAKAQKDLNALGGSMKQIGSLAKTAFAGLAVGLSLKGVADTISEVQKFNEQLNALGIAGEAATAGLHDVQDIAFSTGQSIANVSQVYQQAIEATQQLGGSQADAAKLAEAFTRAAVSEGKSASDAAAQLETLQFALDANNVKTKEFIGLLKSSETFQTAAQNATGKTTAELVKMAQAGEITRETLVGIVEEFQNIGETAQVGITLDRVIESVATLGKTFITSIAEASGLNQVLRDAVSGGGLKDFLDWVRRAGEMLGALIRIIANLAQSIIDLVRLFAQVLSDPGDAVAAAGRFKDAWIQNIQDVSEAMETFANAASGENRLTTPDGAMRSAADLAADKAARDAIDAAAAKEKADKEAKERASAAEKQAREEQRTLIREAEEAGRARAAAAEEVARQEQAVADYLEEGAQAAREMVDAMEAPEIPGLTEQLEEQNRLIEDSAFIIADAFTGLFTGATDNARDFFRTVLQGLAQIAAQRAIAAATEGLSSSGGFGAFISGLFGAKDGAAFNKGRVIPFAKGGVVTQPTLFPMANGTGLMGEAGAEAVMPLRRMRDGRLGVGSASPNVQIVNNTGVRASAQVQVHDDRLSIVLEAAELGASLAEQRVNRSIRSGYGTTAQSIQRTYAIRRAF